MARTRPDAETPIWNHMKGHRTTSNLNRGWSRARVAAEARFRAIEGHYYRPETKGKEVVLYDPNAHKVNPAYGPLTS